MIKVKAYFEKRNQYDNDFIEFIFKDIKDLKKWGKQDFDRKVIEIKVFENNKQILTGYKKPITEAKYFNTIKWVKFV